MDHPDSNVASPLRRVVEISEDPDCVEITNYKAFLGKHTINGGGKNIFICGENGSGKKSQYFTPSTSNLDSHGYPNPSQL
ncbi:MAG: hypothetical protein KKB91_06930 [Proteobacteria bacterium]|nr:hypothetical protein [Desulfocapsa sp.]MBU3945717.1 hypothetical protein [Pseudomonadota bacterium]MCG2745040.1 hypothetical protein [Desulfobacteraceae bacterium]MBU3982841.1 hypothetical protein [Pseudomonadota bacterium]MBU4027435.1 hypothetical protein [Pseudomonadota bacterium]